jgi:hypothetical protein
MRNPADGRSVGRWFRMLKDRQRFPRDERGYPALEPAQIIVLHDVEYVFSLAEMLIGPVQGGVGWNDSDIQSLRTIFSHL